MSHSLKCKKVVKISLFERDLKVIIHYLKSRRINKGLAHLEYDTIKVSFNIVIRVVHYKLPTSMALLNYLQTPETKSKHKGSVR